MCIFWFIYLFVSFIYSECFDKIFWSFSLSITISSLSLDIIHLPTVTKTSWTPSYPSFSHLCTELFFPGALNKTAHKSDKNVLSENSRDQQGWEVMNTAQELGESLALQAYVGCTFHVTHLKARQQTCPWIGSTLKWEALFMVVSIASGSAISCGFHDCLSFPLLKTKSKQKCFSFVTLIT